MTRGARAVLALALLLASAAAGCRPARWGEPFYGKLAVEGKPVERGRLVYLRNCYRCHQGGEGGLGPPINSGTARLLARYRVRRGSGAMPAFDKTRLSDAQLEDLMAYLAALRRQRQVAGGQGAD